MRPLVAADVAAAASMLSQAFEIDPAYRYLFADAATRPAGLSDFFARNLRTHLPFRCTWVALDAAQRMVGTVTVRPPGGVYVSTLTMLRRGLLPFLIAHGREPVRRLLWLKRTYDALEAAAAAQRAHLYVHMMAVSPTAQGQGVGSALLADVLSRMPTAAVPTVLTTHLPRNLEFYRRAGFELLSERTLQPPDAAPYPVWSMRRDAV